MASARNIILRTLITYLFGAVVSVFFILIVLPLIYLPASIRYKNSVFFRVTSWWSSAVAFFAGLAVEVRGNALPEKPAVCVMNHASALDILLVEKVFGGRVRLWLSKHEYASTPVLSWILKQMHVFVDVSTALTGARALKNAKEKAAIANAHVLLFPEGARFDDGDIHEFYKGFSLLARQLNRPVVPLYIHNAHAVYPKGSFLLRSNEPVFVEVGPEFVQGEGESHEHFTHRVRLWFVGARKEALETLSVGKTPDLV